jgi:starch phosphorylase
MVEECRKVLEAKGTSLEEICETEEDAALGNGGLGRLAACFLDSAATLGLPLFGYGINYEYGLFKQEIHNFQQVERPDAWQRLGRSPWQIERIERTCQVPVYGRVVTETDSKGVERQRWVDFQTIIGVPFDMLVAGYGGTTVNVLRLYAARASDDFEMKVFNSGDYIKAVEQKVLSETLSKVLYPSDQVRQGQMLRLLQEYFMVACAMRDILRRHSGDLEGDYSRLPDRIAVQLNDTHPAITVAELMRILIDEIGMEWEQAWKVTTRCVAYTNHTLLPEALERWPLHLFEQALPRHLQIIFEINRRFLEEVKLRWPGDEDRIRRMSLIEEGPEQKIRMANLAIVGSKSVNGVAAIHSELVKKELVPDFYEMMPRKFNNKTNGVTPRRWYMVANPALTALLTETLGTGWISDLTRLKALEPLADDKSFLKKIRAVKKHNKERLARHAHSTTGIVLDPSALTNIQIKRLHLYKRQLLMLLRVAWQYLRIIEDGFVPSAPRVCLLAGKAAPGYIMAKKVIHLACQLADLINRDPRANKHLKMAFLPDYRVSLAEVMIPAADLSEQISTAGFEASGTGNMKFAMNGALTVGTLDGANIEIREEVGAENFYLFGKTVEEIRELRGHKVLSGRSSYDSDSQVRRLMDAFRSGRFNGAGDDTSWVFSMLVEETDPYYYLADLPSYLAIQDRIDADWKDEEAWDRKCLLNIARMGKFSSDRTISEYAREIWGILPVI